MPNSQEGDSSKRKKEQDQRCPFCFSNDQTFSMSRSLTYPINTPFNGLFENFYGPPVILQPGISFCRLATAQKKAVSMQLKKGWKQDEPSLAAQLYVFPFPCIPWRLMTTWLSDQRPEVKRNDSGSACLTLVTLFRQLNVCLVLCLWPQCRWIYLTVHVYVIQPEAFLPKKKKHKGSKRNKMFKQGRQKWIGAPDWNK